MRTELGRVVDLLEDRIRASDDAKLLATDAIPWVKDTPLWEQIGGETFLHWPRHTVDIERASALLS